MSKPLEIVNSGEMKTLAEFDVEYDDEYEMVSSYGNMVKCFIKSSDRYIVFAISSKGNSIPAGNFLMERGSFSVVAQNLKEVLSGKLYEEKKDALHITNGEDKIIISATSVHGANMLSPRVRIGLKNLRDIELDGLNLNLIQLSLPVTTARKLEEVMSDLLARNIL